MMNFLKLMKNAQKIQSSLQEKQKEMEKITVVGESGAGAVKVTVNTRHYIKHLEIADEIFNEAKDKNELKAYLKDLITSAVNQATEKVEQILKSEMMGVNGLQDILGGDSSLKDILGGKDDDSSDDSKSE